MKRGVFDVLRRGFDNTLANWQVILVRLGAMLLIGALAVATVIVIILPILVSAGIRLSNVDSPEDLAEAMWGFLQQWMLLIWIIAAVSVLLLVWIAIHSFVEAGCARVYVDGERMAGPADGMRERFRVFSMQRWLAGGVDGWWTLFWIYNIAWAVAGMILLIPLLPTLILMLLLYEQAPVALGIGCIGLVLTGMLLIVVGVVTGMWSNRAMVDWAVRGAGARESLATAWSAIRADFARHLLITLAIIVISMAGGMLFSSFSLFATIGEVAGGDNAPLLPLFLMPLRLAGSLLSSILTAILTSWYLASYANLAVEGRS
jgi:hypothetical protein